jgi:WhiB family transcriptional regulator, redox-sensing transcriptional regulator
MATPTRHMSEPAVESLGAQRWITEARCGGQTHLFFASAGERADARARRESAAREICGTCPVADECRTYARTHHEYGLWGGETETERTAAGYAPRPVATCTQIDSPLGVDTPRALYRTLARSRLPLSVGELATRLGVSRHWVWQCLERMADVGTVTKTLYRGEPGRPRHRYALKPAVINCTAGPARVACARADQGERAKPGSGIERSSLGSAETRADGCSAPSP